MANDNASQNFSVALEFPGEVDCHSGSAHRQPGGMFQQGPKRSLGASFEGDLSEDYLAVVLKTSLILPTRETSSSRFVARSLSMSIGATVSLTLPPAFSGASDTTSARAQMRSLSSALRARANSAAVWGRRMGKLESAFASR